MQGFFIYILGQQVTGEYADSRSYNQSDRRSEETMVFLTSLSAANSIVAS
ncbi:MAG: hypothetical protein VB977_13625 [Pseudohongiellaceae bacterium]